MEAAFANSGTLVSNVRLVRSRNLSIIVRTLFPIWLLLSAVIFLPYYSEGTTIQSLSTEYSPFVPSPPTNGCPSNTYGCTGSNCSSPHTCFCEEHCSWEMCRLTQCPEECVRDVKSTWAWNSDKHFWVAQLEGKATTTFLVFTFLCTQIKIKYIGI